VLALTPVSAARADSCVAPARYLNGKYGVRNFMYHGKSGNALVDGGVGKTFFMVRDIALPEEGLSFLKVGDAGENIRAYSACCGTLFNSAGGKQFRVSARPLTRNNITRADGSPYIPAEEPTSCGIAGPGAYFEDYEKPEPFFEDRSPALMAGFGKCGEMSSPDDSLEDWATKVGADVDETVPITWEDAPKL
jgi:hypothetical protein